MLIFLINHGARPMPDQSPPWIYQHLDHWNKELDDTITPYLSDNICFWLKDPRSTTKRAIFHGHQLTTRIIQHDWQPCPEAMKPYFGNTEAIWVRRVEQQLNNDVFLIASLYASQEAAHACNDALMQHQGSIGTLLFKEDPTLERQNMVFCPIKQQALSLTPAPLTAPLCYWRRSELPWIHGPILLDEGFIDWTFDITAPIKL